MVAAGFLTICDTLAAWVQTPDRVCQYSQKIKNGRPSEKPEYLFWNQDNFNGRLKMFGKEEFKNAAPGGEA